MAPNQHQPPFNPNPLQDQPLFDIDPQQRQPPPLNFFPQQYQPAFPTNPQQHPHHPSNIKLQQHQPPSNINPQAPPFRPNLPRRFVQPGPSGLRNPVPISPFHQSQNQPPVVQQQRETILTSEGMDKRHPSSFQQLEKVCVLNLYSRFDR